MNKFARFTVAVDGATTNALALLVAFFASSAPAAAQPVSRADLDGAVINVSAVHQETIVRNGEQRNIELHTIGRITVSAGSIQSHFQSMSVNLANGRSRAGAGMSGSNTLDKPVQGPQGNDILWTFANGSLVRLRVFTGGAGGQKMTVSFHRSGKGLSCAFSMPMAREVGVGRIHKGSAIDNAPIDILNFRQVSSSCSMSKG